MWNIGYPKRLKWTMTLPSLELLTPIMIHFDENGEFGTRTQIYKLSFCQCSVNSLAEKDATRKMLLLQPTWPSQQATTDGWQWYNCRIFAGGNPHVNKERAILFYSNLDFDLDLDNIPITNGWKWNSSRMMLMVRRNLGHTHTFPHAGQREIYRIPTFKIHLLSGIRDAIFDASDSCVCVYIPFTR